MYTFVMMAALSAAPEAPQFGSGLFHGRDKASSCQGSGVEYLPPTACYGSCHGSTCYGSCTGSTTAASSSCHGDDKGFGHRLRAFFHRNSNSCYGSCSGKSAGCTGSSCHGSSCGGCCGGGSMPIGAPPPMIGGDFAPPLPAMPSYYFPTEPYVVGPPIVSYAPPAIVVGPPTAVPTIPPLPTAPAPMAPPVVEESRTARAMSASAPNRATVVVRVPADAKLYAEGRPLNLTGTERSFVSPALPAGQEFGYTFRVEYVRDGETISQSRRVSVRAGGTVAVEFADLLAGKKPMPSDSTLTVARPVSAVKPTETATTPPSNNPFLAGTSNAATAPTGPGDRARITVKVPAGSVLTVDGVKNSRTEAIREFRTPALPAGQEFSYVMKVEKLVNGRPESQSQKVVFRAGEIVSVDFTGW